MGYPTYDLTFNTFQDRNIERCKNCFPGNNQTPEFLAIAIAGETGELCNLIKKVMRGDYSIDSHKEEVLDEVADIITYCDLLMSVLGENTAHRLTLKFNEVSERRNWKKYSVEQ